MKRRTMFLLPSAIACLIIASCTSATVDSAPVESDGGSPPPAEAGAPDAVADARPVDDGGTKALEVECKVEPCYLALSGNGGEHTCGLVKDGTVRCWGRDSMTPPQSVDGIVEPGDNALGRGGLVSALESATPQPVSGLGNVTQISVGSNFGTCARTSDGSVFCWGRNDYGQLGRPASEARLLTPTRVEGLPPVDEVQLGAVTACAIGSADRALYCWGQWMTGLGVDAGDDPTFAPQRVSTFRPPVHAVVVGAGHRDELSGGDTIMALLDGGILASVGRHLAVGTIGSEPPSRPAEIEGVARIGAFAFVGYDGLVTRWSYLQDAFGSTTGFVHETLYLPARAEVVDVKLGGVEALAQGGALLSTGRLFRWGLNSSGTLGVDPSTEARANYPREVTGLGGQVVSFATMRSSTCALLVSGEIKCWGANGNGELGRGSIDWLAHPEAEAIR
ncbi:BNR repeat domain protein [Labilithrix luteola]|uniref:BNR repeat domain protein n=1 Tax=Labilithrix luteola TaxID=1391654 RepID=A0A0K1PQ64_9BACT|nr:hypothetical protein [Labilithrix luteola]AKU95526.1 BNR repeat domain protein [Labilithrix luteola]